MRANETNFGVLFSRASSNEDISRSILEENQKKEEFLNNKLKTIESALKALEIESFSKYPGFENSKLRFLFNKRYYNKLNVIDDLFIKADYLDPKSANLIMDEIDDMITSLKKSLEETKITNKETVLC